MSQRHPIGLLLATEEDWPSAFEAVLRRLGPVRWSGGTHEFVTERITHEPFDLRYTPRYALVIDRLSWWYEVPREWLKKIALMDDTYLLNNPFTFQAMEKHSAYCAMMRLGLRVPDTWLLPHRSPPDNPRYERMAERYCPSFDLDEIAARIGYPLFMKPFDGGMSFGVTRVRDSAELHRTYEGSGESLMHLQAAVEPYDLFTRSISIGPQTVVTHYDPTQPHHYKYSRERGFDPPGIEWELETISRLVNAFFRWEFNSCETVVKEGLAHPIDYANAAPDIALTSLNYFFPWAIRSLLAWCVFCRVTGRHMQINQSTSDFFAVGDRDDLGYDEKLERYRELADAYFEADRFEEFCAEALPQLDELVVDYVESPEFDRFRVGIVTVEEQPERHEELIERNRDLIGAWAADQRALAAAP